MRLKRLPVPSDRALKLLGAIVALALVLALAGGTLAFLTLSQKLSEADSRLDKADEDRSSLQSQATQQTEGIEKITDALGSANQRLADAGEPTVPIPEAAEEVVGVPGPQGAPGDRGPRGFTGDEGGTGSSGSDGSDGSDSTVPGPRGLRGFPGPASTVPGPQGPPGPAGADSTIPGPQGPVGPQGERGPTGTAQPGAYSCAEGQYVTGFSVGDAGGVTLMCASPGLIP